MVFQNEIWLISIIGIGLVTLGFIYVIFQSGRSTDVAASQQAYKTSNVLRRWLFLILLLIFAGISYASLHTFPIPPQHMPLQAKQVVSVIGHQWYWEISATQFEVDTPIEFQVTSADVNHGFAIYGPDGRILIQTQAMPGYTNELLYTFDEPGAYTVRCLEYCGLAHHAMSVVLNVVVASGGHN